MLLKDQRVSHEIKEEKKKKNLETNDNENTTIRNLWDVAKTVIRVKPMTM